MTQPAPLPWHRKLLYSVIMLAIVFGAVEGLLAIAGVQPVLQDSDPFFGFAASVPLFVEATAADGTPVWRTAPNKHLFNAQEFPRENADGTRRIFCVGGSTTYGRPFDDATSFAGWLRELLPAADPDTRWEVVNAGGVSYASYRVAKLMEELDAYEPDLVVVYSGQNEFLEERTYRGLKRTPAAVRALSGVLARTRLWAALSSVLIPADEPGEELAGEADTLLEHFGPEVYERDDALREQIVAHYRLSLERMVRLAERAGAGVVFVTPASNLKDCSPFKSQPGDDVVEADVQAVAAHLDTAREHARSARWVEALAELDAAVALDPRYAETHYRRGRALSALGRHDEAATAFERAVVEDVCPLRALPEMQAAVAEVAAATGSAHVDYAARLAARAMELNGQPVPGDELFLDHVHPTIAAHGTLAADLVPGILAALDRPDARVSAGMLAAAGTRIESAVDPEKRAASLANLARVIAWSGKHEDAVGPALQALALQPQDPNTVGSAASILATWYAAEGDTAAERRYFNLALSARPADHDLHFRLGLRALDREPPETDRAAAHLTYAAVFWQGEHRDAPHAALGSILAARGRDAAAMAHLLEARAIAPGNAEIEGQLARLAGRLGPQAGGIRPPQFTVDRHPSGAVRRIIQVIVDRNGRPHADGVWTEWHENGLAARYAEYRGGAPAGRDVRWDVEGRRAP